MQPGRARVRFAALLLLSVLLTGPLAAQQRLYVLEPDGNYHPVVAMNKGRACYLDQGKLSVAQGTRYALRKVEEYLPVFIEVREKEAGSSSLVPLTDGPATPMRLNNEFHFSATFESGSRLETVFLVLELESGGSGRSLFPYEIGRLEASQPKAISVFVPLERNLEQAHYRLMLFVGGEEVFTSEQPDALRESLLDRMVAKRTAGVGRMGPRPLFGPGPRYPEALRQTGQTGEVLVAMTISPRGAVLDPLIERSTHPAFDEAVLAVLPKWRFVPRVEGGHPVETKVKLPMVLAPPVDSSAP